MDWNALIGRWPPEPDALRLLLLIDRLGDDAAGGRRLTGESTLRHLDHLAGHPRTLAYVLIDRFATDRRTLRDRRGEWAETTRRLLDDERPERPSRRAAEHHAGHGAFGGFEPPRWRRLDDGLAFLSSRGLIRVDLEPNDALTFTSTERATPLLDRAITLDWLQRRDHSCATLGAHLPERDGGALLERLRCAARRLQAFRRDADLPPESDPLPRLFHATFRERL